MKIETINQIFCTSLLKWFLLVILISMLIPYSVSWKNFQIDSS